MCDVLRFSWIYIVFVAFDLCCLGIRENSELINKMYVYLSISHFLSMKRNISLLPEDLRSCYSLNMISFIVLENGSRSDLHYQWARVGFRIINEFQLIESIVRIHLTDGTATIKEMGFQDSFSEKKNFKDRLLQ